MNMIEMIVIEYVFLDKWVGWNRLQNQQVKTETWKCPASEWFSMVSFCVWLASEKYQPRWSWTQLDHILNHVEPGGVQACGEQYVFLGNPPPFNGGWHFTALDDFEHVLEQGRLNPSWRGIRVWHKVNFVPSVTEQGEPALVPKEKFPSMWVTVDGRIFQCHVVS